MWTINPPLNLLRYLFVVRVNSALVRLPRCPSLEFSLVLGSLIADRLPTREARHWRKALRPWQDFSGEILAAPPTRNSPVQSRQTQQNQPRRAAKTVPEIVWPVDLVIHVYPGKLIYGRDEIILWEMKLFGRDADHGLFLETLLPAVEEAGITRNPHWKQPAKLWGNFDISAVSVARGLRWEPIVQDSQIDLKTFPTPMQWAEDLHFTQDAEKPLSKLTWLTPFAFDNAGRKNTRQGKRRGRSNQKQRRAQSFEPPTLDSILAAMAPHISRNIAIWQPDGDALDEEEAAETWQAVRQRARQVKLIRNDLGRPPKNWPGQGAGVQLFDLIPPVLEPYLTLASILHVGQYRHFGCGTFMLTT